MAMDTLNETRGANQDTLNFEYVFSMYVEKIELCVCDFFLQLNCIHTDLKKMRLSGEINNKRVRILFLM